MLALLIIALQLIHIPSLVQCQSVIYDYYDKSQSIIVYITSESPIPSHTFVDSFTIFRTAFKSVLYETVSSHSPSSSYNISAINLWCSPSNRLSNLSYDGNEAALSESIYAAFYLTVDYASSHNQPSTQSPNTADTITSLIERIDNDLFPLLVVHQIQSTHPHSALLTPISFTFDIFAVTATKNISFILRENDCVSYLSEVQQKRLASTVALSTDISSDHDDDDDILTIHLNMFIIWTVICVAIGFISCTCIVCCHIRIQEHHRKRKKQKKRKLSRSLRSVDSASPSTVISRRNTNYNNNSSHVIEEGHANENNIGVVRSSSALRTTSDILCEAETRVSAHNTVHSIHCQSEILGPVYTDNRSKKKHRKRNLSMPAFGGKLGYDAIATCDDDDVELKQEEMHTATKRVSSLENIAENTSRRASVETVDQTPNTHNTQATMLTATTAAEKIVTVHVHHHYNPPNASSLQPVADHDTDVHLMEHEPAYPDLPKEQQASSLSSNNYNGSYMLNENDDQNAFMPAPYFVPLQYVNMHQNPDQKEPSKTYSKSQREGFAAAVLTKPRSRKGSSSRHNRSRHSVSSQPEDSDSSVSSQMYQPGPAEDDTPGQKKQRQSPRDRPGSSHRDDTQL